MSKGKRRPNCRKDLHTISTRKIRRNILKKQVGSNKIKEAWKQFQIKKYGFKAYIMMRFFKTSKAQRKALTV
jgi:hypothetical protein